VCVRPIDGLTWHSYHMLNDDTVSYSLLMG